jgi:voltage-dependent anion channel protein 2
MQLTLLPQDLGKSASDLLLKDYPIHGTSLEVKTSSYPTTFKVAGTRDAKSAAIAGDIEGKYVDFKNGITFTQAWTTTNLLRTQVELENQIAKGLKLDLATTLNPAKAQKSAIVTAIYKQPSLHTRATVDMFKVRRERHVARWKLTLVLIPGPHLHLGRRLGPRRCLGRC